MNTPTTVGAALEIAAGERFGFGRNWARFLNVLNDVRIAEAEKSLWQLLGTDDLSGTTFLDVGSGSGLFSLAARRLGARVHSFDYDPQSVACTRELKRRFFDDDRWMVSQGSVLDREFVESLGGFDVVYAWGVLHHTGRMWEALDAVTLPVRPHGKLCLMIYLDRGWYSGFWRAVKRFYCSGSLGRMAVVGAFIPYFVTTGLVADVLRFRNPATRYTEYKKRRGMSKFRDWIDWLGGYPYEVAKRDEILRFYEARGFRHVRHRGMELGYVEYLFERLGPTTPSSG